MLAVLVIISPIKLLPEKDYCAEYPFLHESMQSRFQATFASLASLEPHQYDETAVSVVLDCDSRVSFPAKAAAESFIDTCWTGAYTRTYRLRKAEFAKLASSCSFSKWTKYQHHRYVFKRAACEAKQKPTTRRFSCFPVWYICSALYRFLKCLKLSYRNPCITSLASSHPGHIAWCSTSLGLLWIPFLNFSSIKYGKTFRTSSAVQSTLFIASIPSLPRFLEKRYRRKAHSA